jgi:hypothetical protein
MDATLDFEGLKVVSGPAFALGRDRWLATTEGAKAVLARLAAATDWRTQVTARILLGWLDHRRPYQALIDELDRETWAGGLEAARSRYVARVERDDELRAAILPLCWEAVSKAGPELRRDKRAIFLALLERYPDPLSFGPLVTFIEELADGPGDRRLALAAMAPLPRAPVAAWLEEKRQGHRRRMDRFRLELLDESDFREVFSS